MTLTRPHLPLSRQAGALLLGVFLLGGSYMLYQGIRYAWADTVTLKARRDLAQATKPPMPVLWLEYSNHLKQAIQITPDNPLLYDNLAYLYAARGYQLYSAKQPAEEYFSRSRDYYLQSARLRPMSPFAWAGIALNLHYLDAETDEMWRTFDLAHRYGPNEPGVNSMLAELGYQRHETLTPARRAYLTRLYAEARPDMRKKLEKLAASAGIDPATLDAPPQAAK